MGWRCFQTGWSHLCLGLNDNIFAQNGLLLSAPRPASRPLPQLQAWFHLPTRSNQRSWTFLTNSRTHLPFHFVLAPLTSSVSSSYSSPCSRFSMLPPTLSTSDYGSALPSPWFNPCQAVIKSLVIAKHNGFLYQLSRLVTASAHRHVPLAAI